MIRIFSQLRRTVLLSLITMSLPLPALAQTLPTATQVAGGIKLGWNLGNTMEAPCSETAWAIRR